MKVGVLFSGGKDSCYTVYWALRQNWVVTLISVLSPNPDSYMFHTVANIRSLQAKSMDLPIIEISTSGEKEKEVVELKDGLSQHNFQGLITGAIQSQYQKERVDWICNELGIEHFSPLWHHDPEALWRELLQLKFEVMIGKVAAHGLDETWLGRIIDYQALTELKQINQKYGVHLAGEGGEFESLVLNGPVFRDRIAVKFDKIWEGDSGYINITEANLIQ